MEETVRFWLRQLKSFVDELREPFCSESADAFEFPRHRNSHSCERIFVELEYCCVASTHQGSVLLRCG